MIIVNECLDSINNYMKNYRKQFNDQKSMSKKRNVEWRLSFEEWMSIWESSGHLEQRGRGQGRYVMSRRGDCGPYSVDNVFIQLWEDNKREVFEDPIRRTALNNKKSLSTKGRPRGPFTEQHRENIRKAARQRPPRSLETREKNRQANLGRILGPVEQVSCPHCNKLGGINAMKRWHMDNCKLKEYA
jgi:hypothetical protein